MVLVWHLCLLAFYWHALASWQLSYVLAFLPGFGLLYQTYCGAIPCALWVSGLLLQLSVHIYVCLQFYSAQCSGCLAECCSVLVFFFPSHINPCYYYCPYISTEPSVQCDECLGWGWVWQAGLVAGLWVGQAFGVFLLLGLGVSSSSPQVLRHPTAMCDSGINDKGTTDLKTKKGTNTPY